MVDDNEVPSSLFNTMSRMESRLAALEARSGAEIAALKRDTETIRSSGHEVNNRLTEFVALMLRLQNVVDTHMKACEIRGARLERLAWAAIAGAVTILGILVKAHFFPGMSI